MKLISSDVSEVLSEQDIRINSNSFSSSSNRLKLPRKLFKLTAILMKEITKNGGKKKAFREAC
jgi:hypothetical protein